MRRSHRPGQRDEQPRKQAPELPLASAPSRKPLPEMSASELLDWLDHQITDLRAFRHSIQSYLQRRAGEGRQTVTDRRYRAFLAQSADLLSGLEEWQAVEAKKNQGK